MKYQIVFFCKSIPFSADSIQLKTSLGGSETAMIQVANCLASQGHSVKVFTDIPEVEHRDSYHGVDWYDISSMATICHGVEHDVYISLRTPDAMSYPVRAKYRAIWCQDELLDGEQFYGHMWQADEIMYVSNWQREHYEDQLPPNAKAMAFVTKNPVDLDLIDGSVRDVNRDMRRLIYISRPERGLMPLLDIFPKLRDKYKDMTLSVARYYSMYEPNPNVKAICEEADRRVAATDGVTYLGNLNKADLYREIAGSALMVYPGVSNFNETSCIAALEAQACGTPLICSNRGGLVETLREGAGVKIDGDPYSEEYQGRFIAAVENYLDPHMTAYEFSQRLGSAWVQDHYQAKQIAAEWEKHWDAFFTDRVSKNPQAVFRQLFHHDDMVAAQKLADMYGFSDDAAKQIEKASEKESPEEYAVHALDPRVEYNRGDRFRQVANFISDLEPKKILDFACGNGTFLRILYETFLDAETIDGIDYSPQLCDIASTYNSPAPNVHVHSGSFGQIPDSDYDLIFCGETLEHFEDYAAVIATLESNLSPGGHMVWTLPSGPMGELMTPTQPIVRNHKIHWEHQDVMNVFGNKPGFTYSRLDQPKSPRGNAIGHWIVRHQAGPTGEIDWEKKILTTRPYQTLSACIIVKDRVKDLHRMFPSIWYQCDEIIVGDQNSTDGSRDVCRAYGATIIDLPDKAPIAPDWVPPPGSFEWLRNQTIEAASGDWLFWIDSDEELLRPDLLRRYLDGPAYEGYAIRQNHLMIDREQRHDLPIRLFRNGRGYKFFGHIHEQNMVSLNQPIEPALEIPSIDIAHYGYITENDRRQKAEKRNMALLMYDRQDYPHRELGQVLLAREYLNAISWDIADGIAHTDANGKLTTESPRTIDYAKLIVAIYHEFFGTMNHGNFDLMWPIYQGALTFLGRGVPVACAVNLDGDRPDVYRFESQDQLSKFLEREANKLWPVQP